MTLDKNTRLLVRDLLFEELREWKMAGFSKYGNQLKFERRSRESEYNKINEQGLKQITAPGRGMAFRPPGFDKWQIGYRFSARAYIRFEDMGWMELPKHFDGKIEQYYRLGIYEISSKPLVVAGTVSKDLKLLEWVSIGIPIQLKELGGEPFIEDGPEEPGKAKWVGTFSDSYRLYNVYRGKKIYLEETADAADGVPTWKNEADFAEEDEHETRQRGEFMNQIQNILIGLRRGAEKRDFRETDIPVAKHAKRFYAYKEIRAEATANSLLGEWRFFTVEYDKPWEMWNVPTIPAEWSGADRLAPLIGGKILLLGGEYSPSRRLPGGKGDLKMDDINLPNRFEKNNEVVRKGDRVSGIFGMEGFLYAMWENSEGLGLGLEQIANTGEVLDNNWFLKEGRRRFAISSYSNSDYYIEFEKRVRQEIKVNFTL